MSARQECYEDLCDCRSLSARKLLSFVLWWTKGIHLWEVLLIYVIDATIRQVRDLVVLVYYLKVVNISIVILSDDQMSLENCNYEIKPGKMTSVGRLGSLWDCFSFSNWGGFLWWLSAGPSLGTSASRVTHVHSRQCSLSLSKRSGGNQPENKEDGTVKGWVAHPGRDAPGVHHGSAARGWFGELPWERERDRKRKGKQNMGKHFFSHWFSFHNASKLEKRYSSIAKGLQHDSRSKIIEKEVKALESRILAILNEDIFTLPVAG